MNDKQTVEELAEKHFPIDVEHPNGLHRPLRISERKAFIIGYKLGQSTKQEWIDEFIDKLDYERTYTKGQLISILYPPPHTNKDTQNS